MNRPTLSHVITFASSKRNPVASKCKSGVGHAMSRFFPSKVRRKRSKSRGHAPPVSSVQGPGQTECSVSTLHSPTPTGSAALSQSSQQGKGAPKIPTDIMDAGIAPPDLDADLKKLVIQYSLERFPHMSKDGVKPKLKKEVKVKARVEESPLSYQECLANQEEETRHGLFVHHVQHTTSPFDATCAIDIATSYIIAYRALYRTENRSLAVGDGVLVIHGHGPVGRAVIDLALLAKARAVFAVAPIKYHDKLRLKGAIPIDESQLEKYEQKIGGSMNVVIDTDGGKEASAFATSAVNTEDGKLVRVMTGSDTGTDLENMKRRHKKKGIYTENSHYYDIVRDVEKDPGRFR
eukprot:1483681-Ditylum_brightwellii.AAC.1